MTDEKDTEETDWIAWRNTRIGKSGEDAPQKANLKFGRIAWCMSFDKGDQFKILNEITGTVDDVYTTRETRCIYNICKTFNDAYASKMWKGNPLPTTTPFSTNTEDYDEDVNVATNAAIEYWWKTAANGAMKLFDTTRTAAVGGIGYIKEYYDKNKKGGLYKGEVILEKLNPLHCYPNADATNDEEFRDFLHRFPKEKSVAEEEFAEKMKELGLTELEPQSKSDAHPELGEATKKLDGGHSAEAKNTVIEDDIWIKECKKYPNGKHVVLIGDHKLVDEDNPDPDKLPFFCYVVNPQDGDLYGLGITYPIIPIQRDINKINSVISENIDYMGHLMWLIKEGSISNPAGIGDLAGQWIEYSGETEPRQSKANPLPVHITGRTWDLIELAKLITHIQDLSLSILPKRGSQMAQGTTQELVNSEAVMFAPDVQRMVEFIIRIIRRYLYLAKNYYPEDRIVTIVGENKRPEAMTFKHEKLDDNYNVDIKVGSGFDRSDDAQVTAITNLMQTPAFEQAGVDPRVIMEELLRKQGLTKLREDTFKDERQAKRYLEFIVNNPGVDYPQNRYVNPIAHIKVFTDYTKLPNFDNDPPEVRGAIEKYVDRMIAMLPPPPGATTGGASGTPGNENPVITNPNEVPNLGGRPPEGNMMEAASPPAPQGEI